MSVDTYENVSADMYDNKLVEIARVYEGGVLIQEAKLCISCRTETTDADGCMCSHPKGYCEECNDTKCFKHHDVDYYGSYGSNRRGLRSALRGIMQHASHPK
jgi:hypothetical protein